MLKLTEIIKNTSHIRHRDPEANNPVTCTSYTVPLVLLQGRGGDETD